MSEETDLVEKAPPSCASCRHRKAKCDRQQPCGNCLKSGRSCFYETIQRTPLTRKHLTDVEKELAETKARLQQFQQRLEHSPAPSNRIRDDVSVTSPGGHENARSSDSRPTTADTASGSFVRAESRLRTGRTSALSNNTVNRLMQPNHEYLRRRRNKPSPPQFALETPPAGDFDWDERSHDTSNGHFVDGMATSPGRGTRGYMGVTSGAALLRLEDGSTVDGDADQDGNLSDEAMARYSPVPAIYSPSQLEPFIDAYFQTYHISYPIVHEATFKAQFMEVIPRPKGNAWQVLLHIVAALGSFSASEMAPEADVALFEAAKARMGIDMLETGNIVLVQALTLMSNYVQKRNKPNSGYNYLGLAKRMAMGLALHKEFPSWQDRPFVLEIRRRVWWCLYIFDTGAIITFSRPLDLPQDGIEVQLPRNIHDSDVTASTKRTPQDLEMTTLYSHVRCQSEFHLATTHIYERLISTVPSAEEMLELDQQHLSAWLAHLPPWFSEGTVQLSKFRLCHSILQWRWRNFRILMYRPYLMRRFMTQRDEQDSEIGPKDANSSESQAISRCLEAATQSVTMITHYWHNEKQNVLTCWYALYFLFQSILIPVICLRNRPQSPEAPMWRDLILAALGVIADMNRLNNSASRCHDTIVSLCGPYLAQDITMWESPTHESPQTQLNNLSSFMWPIVDPELPTGYDLAMQETSTFDFMSYFQSA